MPPTGVHKILLLNASDPGEIRVAVIEDGQLTEIFMERKSRLQQTGNIFKGRVVNVEPSLQASFVDLGLERNGFLHASDCIPPDGGFTEILRPSSGVPAEQGQVAPVPVLGASPSAAGGAPVSPIAQEKVLAPARGKRRSHRRGGRSRAERSRINPAAAPMIAPDPPHLPVAPPASVYGFEPPAVSSLALPGQPEDSAADPAHPRLPSQAAVTSPTEGASQPAEARPESNGLEEHEVRAAKPEFSTPSATQDISSPTAAGGGALLETPLGEASGTARDVQRNNSGDGRTGRTGRRLNHERRYMVQDMLHKGDAVLVQVAKEGLGQKGPALTTYLSLPGRYLVLMPAIQRLGVSKRIESEERRRELKEILGALKPPEGMGVIVRTAGVGRSKDELQRDLDFLIQKWEALKQKAQTVRAPALLFQEADVVTRVFRDILTDDVAQIVVDDSVAMERAREFLSEIAPQAAEKLEHYSAPEPIFHKYGVEHQIQQLFNRKVPLKSGGSIVIEQTEALVAIDVNTGRFREKHNQDETILATNLEAAREIARQLRLRDIGGLVMLDFIDMDVMEHRRRVERELKAHLARDKARINVLPISALGIVEMTRQRVRHGLRRTLFDRCAHCSGTGQVKSPETLGLELLREVRNQLREGTVSRVRVTLHPTAACAILNRYRRDLAKLEEARGVTLEIVEGAGVLPGQMHVSTAREGGDWVLKKVSEVDDYVRNS